ncbi:MAG: hypothetical protein GW917_03425 [Bdellovibrionales bacterium]|nr:hypothetical protein [Bdellovibrionales bacterium]
MKLVIAALAIGIFSMPALAGYARYPYYSTSVSCNEIQSAIQANGALVIYRAPHLYDAYAINTYYCQGYPEKAVRTTIPTKDGRCPVKKCVTDHDR